MSDSTTGGEATPSTQPGGAPDEPPTLVTPPPPRSVRTLERAEPSASPAPAAGASAQQRRPRLWWRVLRVVLLLIALPAIALGIGLLVAYLVHQGQSGNTLVSPPTPSASSSPSASPSPSPSASAAAQVTVPSGWVTEVSPPAGLSYRHPAGWIRRTSSPEVFRFEPASSGSQDPGVQGVGAGLETSTDPGAALATFVARAYGGESQFVGGAVTSVVGQHPGELQEIVTYARGGVTVRVVAHSFASEGQTVVAVGRSLNSQPAQAALLQAQLEASLTF